MVKARGWSDISEEQGTVILKVKRDPGTAQALIEFLAWESWTVPQHHTAACNRVQLYQRMTNTQWGGEMRKRGRDRWVEGYNTAIFCYSTAKLTQTNQTWWSMGEKCTGKVRPYYLPSKESGVSSRQNIRIICPSSVTADGNAQLDAPLITLLFHALIIRVIPEVADVMRGSEKK